ncbi:SGNH/GDSL hydrolase family protein [Nocardia sp. XZ_19_231]|uniref:SGNH/GDSL hydrolase family protein n=1 Tax=Nocardia sp. XZ_19_231 TaxID=2769252 RepID=UPI00188E75B2|nr:SGNH/GDSL hydrolase family protein [Nocardia sp. XZ_19_231]
MTVRLRWIAAPVAAVAALALVAFGARDTETSWSSAWATSVQYPIYQNWSAMGFADQTVRQVIRLSQEGPQVRIRLSNRYGQYPLPVSSATVARSAGGAAVVPESVRALTVGGQSTFVIAPGHEMVSDAVDTAGVSMAVTLYFAQPTGPATQHGQALATSYRAHGDHSADPSAAPFTDTSQSWYYLAGVDTLRPSAGDVTVAFGDSLTDGYRSTLDADQRYPDQLAAAGHHGPVVNAGISGNRLLTDSTVLGDSALARFRRDVLEQPGVGTAVVLIGINDIGLSGSAGPDGAVYPKISSDQLIAGYRELIDQARASGVHIVGATIPPFAGSTYFSPEKERLRTEVNTWMRVSGAFDKVVDLEQALAAPGDHTRLADAFDSGDHLHPNDSGYRAMATVIAPALAP